MRWGRPGACVEAILHWDTYNLGKIAAHGVTPGEVDEVLADPDSQDAVSRSSGRPITRGYTAAGRWLVVVYEELDDNPRRVYPITAYEPGSRP